MSACPTLLSLRIDIQSVPRAFLKQLGVIASVEIFLSTLLRIYFLFHAPPESLPVASGVANAFVSGLLFDISTAVYWLSPLALLYVVLPPSALRMGRFAKWFFPIAGFIIFVWCYAAAAEIVFWEEFSSRFNFIAVDYLVYTNEVLANIWESYPIVWESIGILIVSLVLILLIKRWLPIWYVETRPRKSKLLVAGIAAVLFTGNYFLISENLLPPSTSHIEREITKNGLAALFAAYLNNEIDYDQFYVRITQEEAFARIKKLPNSR